ncbi:MAG: TIGR03067 domain-containing protein [Gemmatimonadales bacterium]
MSRISTLAVVLTLMAASGTQLHAQRNAAVTDSARLQGTWTMISGSASGMVMPANMVAGMKRAAVGNQVTITMHDHPYFSATFTLNPAATPKAIDYQMTGGPTTGFRQLGIYEIRGDTVQFSFGAPNAARPVTFASVTGDELTVSRWVRVKP